MTYRRHPAPKLENRPLIALSIAVLMVLAGVVARAEEAALPRVDAPGARPVGLLASTTLLINEIDYDQPSTDYAEFVEIKNVSAAAIDLSDYELRLVSGDTGVVYKTIPLPSTSLAAGDYYVVCADNTYVDNCNLDVTPDTNLIQNGAPDAVAIADTNGIVDTVSYEGDSVGGYTEGSGSGLQDNGGTADIDEGISRYTDGTDTDQNNSDLSVRCISPGEANVEQSSGCAGETATPTLTSEATNTPGPGTPTAAPPTATPDAPTATPGGPTDTPAPATNTPQAPTATVVPPTSTTGPTPTTSPPTATPIVDPLAVELAYFRARRTEEGDVVTWRTISEIDHAGFLVLRGAPGGTMARVSPALIPGRGHDLGGADYMLFDRDAPTALHWYWLEDVDTRGVVTRHGPAVVRPNYVAVTECAVSPESLRSVSTARWSSRLAAPLTTFAE